MENHCWRECLQLLQPHQSLLVAVLDCKNLKTACCLVKLSSLLVFPIRLSIPLRGSSALQTAEPTIPLCPAMYILVFFVITLLFISRLTTGSQSYLFLIFNSSLKAINIAFRIRLRHHYSQ